MDAVHRHFLTNYESQFTKAALAQAITYKGISHLGKGFDYVRMNSYDLTTGGQEKDFAVLDIDPDKSYFGHTTHNQGFKKSTTVKSAVDYSRSQANHVHVEASVGIPVVLQGSASADITSRYKSDSSESTYYSYVRAIVRRKTYSVSNDLHEVPLTNAFTKRIKLLPVLSGSYKDASSSDQGKYNKIIDMFGTHFSYHIMLGGKYFMNKKIASSTYKSMLEKEVNVEAGASGTFEEVSAGGKVGINKKDTAAYSSAVSVTHEDLVYVGGNEAPTRPSEQADWGKV